MNEKQTMENLLLVLKGECDLMMHGAIESATTNVHSEFTRALSDVLSMQNEVYSAMARAGMYPATTAEQKQIQLVRDKFQKNL